MILLSHMTSEDHVTKGSCDFKSKNPLLRYVNTLPSLVATGIVIVEICF